MAKQDKLSLAEIEELRSDSENLGKDCPVCKKKNCKGHGKGENAHIFEM